MHTTLAAFVIYVVTSGSNQETGTITGISGNNLTVQGLKVSHGAGAWVVLDRPCCAVYVRRGATQAGSMGIGNGVGASLTGSEGLITILYPAPAGVQPAEFSDSASFGPNFGSTADYWVVGTASDNYLPSFY